MRATYAAKENGRNQYQLFSEAMLKESQDRLSMDTALRHAMAREELFLHYQPLVSLTTGTGDRDGGAAALAPPQAGHCFAGDVYSASGRHRIDCCHRRVGDEAILQAGEAAVRRAWAWTCHVSVNLSPRQFEQPNLLQVIDEALEESGLPAQSLQVELTENTLMINSASEPGEAAADSPAWRARCD